MLNNLAELDALPCAVIVTDTGGAILFINQWAQTTFGLTEAAQPDRLEHLLPLAGQIFLQTHILPMLRSEGEVKEIYLQFSGPELTRIPMLLNAIKGMFGELACYRWVMLPAQHRAEFEQQLLKNRQQMQEFARAAESDRKILQTVLDGVKDVGILALSADGCIEFANTGAELLFQATTQQLVKSQIENWLSLAEAERQIFVAFPGQNLTQPDAGHSDFETLLNLTNGQQIDVQVQLRRLEPYQTLNALGFIMIITDIQQRKRYQALQNNFIANISHELRTPLTSILGALKLLSIDKKSDLTIPTRKLVDLTLKNANRLHQLIIDILDFSKLNTGKMSVQITSLELVALLQQAVDEQLYYLPAKHIHINFTPPSPNIQVLTDAGRFLQVMSNLLANAKKFSPANTTITVYAEIADDLAKVSIADQGPGVAEGFLPLLFSQFSQQDDSASRAAEGTGLGLAICKQLVQAMGGEIGYRQNADGGATFWFTAQLVRAKH